MPQETPNHEQPAGQEIASVFLRKPRFVKGLVAIFDVLGFKSFCLNNSDQAVAEDVLSTIDLVPEGMAGLLSSLLGGEKDKDGAKKLVSQIEWLVFSDTVLAALPQPEQEKNDLIILFFGACAIFNRLMFDRGLPVRGSIQLGDFLLGNRCVAGKVIVEALNQVHALEAACTVLSNDAWAHVHDRFVKDDKLSLYLFGMLPRSEIPCKGGSRMLASLNWFNVRIGNTPEPTDLSKYVMTSFLSHGKQLDTSAFNKAQNTANLFTSWLSTRVKKPEFTPPV